MARTIWHDDRWTVTDEGAADYFLHDAEAPAGVTAGSLAASRSGVHELLGFWPFAAIAAVAEDFERFERERRRARESERRDWDERVRREGIL